MQKLKYIKGEGEIGTVIVVALLIWGAYVYFGGDKEKAAVMKEHINYETYKETKDCSTLEPNNPYDEGSSHYAGFQWGEDGNDCGGNSDSFIDGCEDYERQEAAFQACESR
jgi:hypothetical protein